MLDPFAKGSRYWSVTLGASRDPDLGRIYLTQFSVDHYIHDDLSIRAGLNFGYARADRTDGGVQGGPELGFRWHFISQERFSTFLDGSAAAIIHENPLTEDSLRFNFDLQAGFGATLHFTDDTHLQAGIRWHHLSNARIRGKSRNLGYDGPLLYGGVMWRF